MKDYLNSSTYNIILFCEMMLFVAAVSVATTHISPESLNLVFKYTWGASSVFLVLLFLQEKQKIDGGLILAFVFAPIMLMIMVAMISTRGIADFKNRKALERQELNDLKVCHEQENPL